MKTANTGWTAGGLKPPEIPLTFAYYFQTHYLQEISMSRHLSLGFLSALIVYGLSIVFAPPALAVNCDVNVCMSKAFKVKIGRGIQVCNSSCQLTIEERRKKGQCK